MLTPEQISSYLEDSLGPEERARVEAVLAGDPDAAHQLGEQQRIDRALGIVLARNQAHEQVKRSILAAIRCKPQEQLASEVMQSLQTETQHPTPPRPASPTPWISVTRQIVRGLGHRRLAWVSLTLACLVSFFAYLSRNHSETAGAVKLAEVTSPTRIERRGESLTAPDGFTLLPGDVLQTEPGSAASIRFPDATQLRITSSARIRIPNLGIADSGQPTEGKRVILDQGFLAAAIAPQQRNKPFLIETPHLRVTVVGTRFELTVDSQSTILEVGEGKVEVADSGNPARIPVAAGQSAVTRAGQSIEVRPRTRDPGKWPFSWNSPWNLPLGSEARFEAIDSEWFALRGPLRNVAFVRQFFPRERGAIMRQLSIPGQAGRTLPISDQWTFSSTSGLAVTAIFDTALDQVMEFKRLIRLPSGDVEAQGAGRGDLRGLGVHPDWRGVAEYGGSAIAGAIRQGEFTGGIPHALSLNVPAEALNRRGPNGRPYVWPAARARPEQVGQFARRGNLHMGSLLGIPPTVDIGKLGVGVSGPGYELARALQDYGAYITDCSGDSLHVFVIDAEVPQSFEALVATLLPHLHVVVNNRSDTPGGGGIPRRLTAPPFQAR